MSVCPRCKQVFERPFKRGRPRIYCSEACQRANRSGQRAAAQTQQAQWLQYLTAALSQQTRELSHLLIEDSDHDVKLILDQVAQLRKQVDLLTGAAVSWARSRSHTITWKDVGEVFEVNRRTASSRWDLQKVLRQLGDYQTPRLSRVPAQRRSSEARPYETQMRDILIWPFHLMPLATWHTTRSDRSLP